MATADIAVDRKTLCTKRICIPDRHTRLTLWSVSSTRADAFTDLEVSGVGLEEAFIALTHRTRHRETAPEGRTN